MNKKILLAEDNPGQARMIQLSLELEGYEVIWEKDGEAALSSIKTLMPDLVILDIMMPVMDGYQVLEKMKEDKSTSRIPVIFLTAKDYGIDLIKGMKLGAVDYITKPFIPKLFVERIKLALNSKKTKNS